jgi:alpha-L-fucosidase
VARSRAGAGELDPEAAMRLVAELGVPLDRDLTGKSAADWDSEGLMAMARLLRPGILVDEQGCKSVEQLVAMLVDVVSKGGNLLLNVGPNARGELDPRALERLRGVGAWTRLAGRAIYGCTEAPPELEAAAPPDTRLTINPQTGHLYVHLLRWPAQPLVLSGLRDRIAYAQLLHNASELRAPTDPTFLLGRQPAGALVLGLPATKPDVVVPGIELTLAG